jgi:hypothetical protein
MNNETFTMQDNTGQTEILMVNSWQTIGKAIYLITMTRTVTSMARGGLMLMSLLQFRAILAIVSIVGVSVFDANDVKAATYYVSAGNPAPVAPYSSWTTAATNIQDAIAQTVNGDTVLVTNGIYAYGGAAIVGTFTNRVALTNAVTVESVNGPWVTTILGSGPAGPKVRCAWLTNGASLIGFTVTGGSAVSGELVGGGIWCASSNAYVQDCVIVSNIASQVGVGVYQGTVTSCLLRGNTGGTGAGAAYKAVLNNCTIVSNSTSGVDLPLAMTNCIIYFNSIGNFSVSGSAFVNCCTTPALAGTGNFTNAPVFFADGVHQANNSPCAGTGAYIGGGADLYGNPYLNPPSVGCAEQPSTPVVTAPQITLTSNPIGFTAGNFSFIGSGPITFRWLQNGQPLVDDGHFSGTQSSNLLATGVSLADAGNYQVVLSNGSGSVTSAVASLVIHCVNIAGTGPVPPYTSWVTAATNIQDSITASAAGDVVLVTNGLYGTGGRILGSYYLTNRVSINKFILLDSVNGAAATIIQGAWDPTSTNGPNAVRCVWMTNAIISGFTIRGGGTRELNAPSDTTGGGILAVSTNSVICNCILVTNIASGNGGGICGTVGASATAVIGCKLIGNEAIGSQTIRNYGGGAFDCNLQNCLLLNNSTPNGNGGGAGYCYSINNCAFIGNSAYFYGGAAYGGTLVNCTVTSNTIFGYLSDYGAAVRGAVLTNCVVFGNLSRSTYATNYASCTLAYCCADPQPPGPGNIDVNPQVLADGFHLAQTSPCIGRGISNVVSGTDIDGQPWNTPPSIGCDEWYPAPLIAVQPNFQIGFPPHDLMWSAAVAGQSPLAYFWTQNGVPIQDDGHHSGSSTPNMAIYNFGPSDAGLYQLVATNSSGSVTSAVIQVVIHAVDASGVNPVPPYSSWVNAATTIQDAINVASPGDIVLVTNGTYSSGGMVQSGGLTNRVMLNKALTVISVNGFKSTVIQGAWDPISTNGPSAVRCAWVSPGAVLNGFTLQNGATFGNGNNQFDPLLCGGGVWGNYSTNAVVLNCVLTNNSAVYGGGAAWGTVNSSLIIGNQANFGGGSSDSSLNNCTVENNNSHAFSQGGGGTYAAVVRNSIVIGNFDANFQPDDHYSGSTLVSTVDYAYSCSSEQASVMPSGVGNITQNPIFVDLYHMSTLSPCVGAGSAAYSTGYDLDGQPWNNPPSMGCSEIILSNLVGPLSVNCSAYFTNMLVSQNYNHFDTLYGTYQGRAAYLTWSFGDGPVYSNMDATVSHQWTNTGDYTVTFTAYNNDNPNGVSTNIVVHVQSLLPFQIQSPALLTNGFSFQFAGQASGYYNIYYATNLTPPVTWQFLRQIAPANQGTFQVVDPSWTNAARFYHITAQ